MFSRLFTILLITSTVVSCGSIKKREPTDETKVLLKDQKGESKEAPTAPTVHNTEKEITPINPDEAGKEAAHQAEEVKKAVATAAQHIQTTHGETTPPPSSRKTGLIPAEKALGWLRNGNTRFIKGTVRKDGAGIKDRLRISSQQNPHSVVLSCSDSQIPPEVVFDQKLGEIFVVRTFGQSLDNNVIGSIEQAVLDLGSNLIVVMGHESCEAISTALSSWKGMSAGSPALEGLINDIKPRLKQYSTSAPSAGLLDESWGNVEGISKDLLERSAILRDAVASGDVKIVKAMYHLESGQVEWR